MIVTIFLSYDYFLLLLKQISWEDQNPTFFSPAPRLPAVPFFWFCCLVFPLARFAIFVPCVSFCGAWEGDGMRRGAVGQHRHLFYRRRVPWTSDPPSPRCLRPLLSLMSTPSAIHISPLVLNSRTFHPGGVSLGLSDLFLSRPASCLCVCGFSF